VAVIGGGIVGLATAYALQSSHPDVRIVVLEKESHPAMHQTGRNSGVVHSGIYYRPGSLKATLCRAGKAALEQFCRQEEIPLDRCGKVIVATDAAEAQQLEGLERRGHENGVVCRQIGPQELQELEPHARGVAALHVPETGIVDYVQVSQRLAERLRQHGSRLLTDSEVVAIGLRSGHIDTQTRAGTHLQVGWLVNCGGLYSDRIMRLAGGRPSVRIVPFRGEYYQLRSEAQHLCRNLIYPVPNPQFPFLGVHLTRMIGGGVECGPNAVLALAREGYDWSTLRGGELLETLGFSGFRRLAGRHWRMGMGEIYRSLSKKAFASALAKLVPCIEPHDLVPCRAGVRAQAVTPSGELVDDFVIHCQGRMVHVCNAPSPAATASLAIGQRIADQVASLIDSGD